MCTKRVVLPKVMEHANKNKKKYIHTYVHTYIHTYIHIYTRTYIHTYIHTHMYVRCLNVYCVILSVRMQYSQLSDRAIEPCVSLSFA